MKFGPGYGILQSPENVKQPGGGGGGVGTGVGTYDVLMYAVRPLLLFFKTAPRVPRQCSLFQSKQSQPPVEHLAAQSCNEAEISKRRAPPWSLQYESL